MLEAFDERLYIDYDLDNKYFFGFNLASLSMAPQTVSSFILPFTILHKSSCYFDLAEYLLKSNISLSLLKSS